MINFAWAKTPADHMDQYADIVGSSQGKGVPAGMMAQMQRHASYIKTKLTPEEHAKLHKNISAHANRLMKDDEISAEEANKIKSIYTPSRVDESKNVSHLQEELSASDPASVWISHFVNSDNPKFSGKSKEQRKQMALAAYYAAKKEGNDMSEESKNLDESPSARELETDMGPRGHRYRIDQAIRNAYRRDDAAGKNRPPSASSRFHYDDLYNRQVLQPGQKQRGQYVLKNTIGQGAPDASKTRALYLRQSGYEVDARQSLRAAAKLNPGERLRAATGPTIRKEESENLDESPSANALARGTGPRSDSYHTNLNTRIHRLMVGPMHPTAAPGPMAYDELRRRQRLNAGRQGTDYSKDFVSPDRLKRHIKAAHTERGGVVKDQDKGARLRAATGPTVREEESKISFSAFRQKLDERVLSLLPEAELDEARIRGPNFDRLVPRGRLFRNQKPTPSEVETLKWQIKDTNARGGLPGPKDKLPEEIEGQHYCAKHVYSEVYGEGVVVEGQHAEPDDNGNIEWYTVQFEHGEEVIFTEDVEVMMAEYHNNHSSMKKKSKKAKE